jgi:hypothetical protein
VKNIAMRITVVSVIICLFSTSGASAQFEAIKKQFPGSEKMQKIYSVDSAVFAVLLLYSKKHISKQVWQARTNVLTKKYDALGCKYLGDAEKELWKNHKQSLADQFLLR